MARVNVEERFFAEWNRIQIVANEMGWSRHQVIGVMVDIWHKSQGSFKAECTAQDLADWLIFDTYTVQKLVSALKRAKYLKETTAQQLSIAGNFEQINSAVNALDRSKKGGLANKKRWEQINSLNLSGSYPQDSQRIATSYLEDSPIQGNARQGSAGQCNSDTNVYASEPADSTLPTKFLKLWNDNCSPLPKAERLTDSRRLKIKKRLQEQPDMDYWAACVKRMAASNFVCSGSWANLDWLIANDTNHVKATEGKYDNPQSRLSNRAKTKEEDDTEKRMNAWAEQEHRKIGLIK